MPSLRMLRKLKNELKLNQILGNTISPSSSPSPSLPPTPPPPHSKLERIADEFLSLNKVEKHDFATLFKLKLGIDRYAHLAAASGGAAFDYASSSSSDSNTEAPAAAVARAKSTFAVKLEKYDATAKIKIIKEVRTFTDLGLKEAKDLVEKVPAVLRTGLSKEEADTIIDKLKQLGATAIAE